MDSHSDSNLTGDTNIKGDYTNQPVYRIIQLASGEMDANCGVGPANGVAYLAAAANLIRQTDAESSLYNAIVPRAVQTVTITTNGNTLSSNNGRLSDTDSDDSVTSAASAYRNAASSGSNVEFDSASCSVKMSAISNSQSHPNSLLNSTPSLGSNCNTQQIRPGSMHDRMGGDSLAGTNGTYANLPTSTSSAAVHSTSNGNVLPVGQVAQIGSQLYVVMPAASHEFGRLLTTATPPSSGSVQQNVTAVKRERRTSIAASPHESGAMHTLAVAAAYQTRDDKRRATHNEVERRRRDKINTWIRELALVVPPSSSMACASNSTSGLESPSGSHSLKHASSSTSSTHSKGDVLSRACEYIRALENTNDRLRNELVELDLLRRENELLKTELRKHGIVPPSLSINNVSQSKSFGEVVLDVCSSENVAAVVTVSGESDSGLQSSNRLSRMLKTGSAPSAAKRMRNGDYVTINTRTRAQITSSCDAASTSSSDSDTLALPSAAALNVQLQSLPD